jgi:hypothetical protein
MYVLLVEKLSGQFLDLIVMSHWLGGFEFEFGTVRLFYLYHLFVGESRLLISWCVGGRCYMTGSDDDCDRSRRHGVEEQGWSHRSGTQWSSNREVRWWCVRSAPCMWRWRAWVSWLSLKTKVDDLSMVWHQNHWDGFLWFDLKIGDDSFSGLTSKPVATVFWLSLKTKVVGGFPV